MIQVDHQEKRMNGCYAFRISDEIRVFSKKESRKALGSYEHKNGSLSRTVDRVSLILFPQLSLSDTPEVNFHTERKLDQTGDGVDFPDTCHHGDRGGDERPHHIAKLLRRIEKAKDAATEIIRRVQDHRRIERRIDTDHKAPNEELTKTEAHDRVRYGLRHRQTSRSKQRETDGEIIAFALAEFSPQRRRERACDAAAAHDEAGNELHISHAIQKLGNVKRRHRLDHEDRRLQTEGDEEDLPQMPIMEGIREVFPDGSIL